MSSDSTVKNTLKYDTTKFMLMFPDEYAIAPASLAHSSANEETVGECNLYAIDYMETYYDTTDRMYSENLPSCRYNYLHHYLGNSVEFLAPPVTLDTINNEWTNAVLERYNETDTTDLLEYVFTLRVTNPENGYNSYNAKDRYDYHQSQLWTDYETYSRKFWMAVYDKEIVNCADNNCGRGYGVLTSNWIGFNAKPKPLYVWDDTGRIISEQNPIRVNSGQQSRWHYIGTE